MKYLLLVSLLFFNLTACSEADKQAKQKIQQEKDALMSELKAKDEALQKAREETQILQKKILQAQKAQQEAFIKAEKQKLSLAKHVTSNDKLSSMGLHLEDNKITIDTNQTKHFFQNIGKLFQGKIEKLSKNLEKGIVDQKEAGVHIDQSHINIDLNQSKHFLNIWGQKMQNFVKEFDTMANDVDTQPKIKTH